MTFQSTRVRVRAGRRLSATLAACAVVAAASLGPGQGNAPADGAVFGWGLNDSGQVGDATHTDRLSPVAAALVGTGSVAAGEAHSLALAADGTVWSWGRNESGQLGTGNRTSTAAPMQVIGLPSSITRIAAGADHSLALDADGTVWAWGGNAFGQLGDGTTSDALLPVQVLGVSNVVALAAGEGHTLGLGSDGTVWAWGRNDVGQLGDGTATAASAPVQVTDSSDPSGLLTAIAQIAAGSTHSLAVKSDGTLRAWGGNDQGQVGASDTSAVPSPVVPHALAAVVKVAAGRSHSLALTADGAVWAWGANPFGQLGQRPPEPPPDGGTGSGERSPGTPPDDGSGSGERPPGAPPSDSTVVRVEGLAGIVAVDGGSGHSLALASDGSVWAWGLNSSGQLGDGTTENRSTAARLVGIQDALAIAAGGDHSLAVSSLPADLSVTHALSSGTARPVVGVGVTFSTVATNHGPGHATNAVVTIVVPEGLRLVSSSATRGSCGGGGTISCTVGTLLSGESVHVSVSTVARHPGVFTSTARGSATERDRDPADNEAAVDVLVVENLPPAAHAGADQLVAQRATVTLDGSRSADPSDGDVLRYRWELVGGGPLDLAGADTAAPSFVAPDRVDTLHFRLTVTDLAGNASSDDALVTILEDPLHAVYVSSTAGSDGSFTSGGPHDPFRTLERGMAAAASRNPRAGVYVHAGTYEIAHTLRIENGVSVYGGFDLVPVCHAFASDGRCVAFGSFWSRAAGTPTRIVGPTVRLGSGHRSEVAVDASDIHAPTVIDGLTVEVSDALNEEANQPMSDSSIAIYVRSSGAGLRISNNKIVAGRGAAGYIPISRMTPEHGKDGQKGGDGADDDENPGGNYYQPNGGLPAMGPIEFELCRGGVSSWEIVRGTTGGTGGQIVNSWVIHGRDGGSYYSREGLVPGGVGGSFHSDNEDGRSNGGPGRAGVSARTVGQGGAGGSGAGRMLAFSSGRLQWFGSAGAHGTPGPDGEGGTGGGGGGGQKGGFVVDGSGAGGGGGGMGGCGGPGGEGGGAGGGSFGIVLVWSRAVVTDNDITTRGGGDGGAGANGVPGGRGGAGGAGGTGSDEVGHGGAGGRGGDGAGGGGGGGGGGGSSCGVLLHDSPNAVVLGNFFGGPTGTTGAGSQIGPGGRGGAAGRGGAGGNGRVELAGTDGAAGEPGRRRNICPPPATADAFQAVNLTPRQSSTGIVPIGVTGGDVGIVRFGSQWIGSDVEMTLVSPGGMRIGRGVGTPDVVHALGPNFESYAIANPERGNWRVELFAADVPLEGEPVRRSVITEARNQPPSANAGRPQVLECLDADGARATLSARGSFDPDGDPLTFDWRDARGEALGADSRLEVALPLGMHDFSLAVADGRGGHSAADTRVNIADTTPPVLTLSNTVLMVTLPSAAAGGAIVDLDAIATAVDACDPAPHVTHDAPALFRPGGTVVTFAGRDASGNETTAAARVSVIYRFGGIEPPIGRTRQSGFRVGRSIPVKFRLFAADGSVVSSARATLRLERLADADLGRSVPVGAEQPFRFDGEEGQYIAIVATRGFTPGRYAITIVLDDGTTHGTTIVLR